jgi:perosamine synthetase
LKYYTILLQYGEISVTDTKEFAQNSRIMIPLTKPTITKEELKSVLNTLITDHIEESTISQQFERELARFMGAAAAVIANSLTAAIHLLFLHLKLEPGDKILLPALLPPVFYDAVRYCQLEPLLYDHVGEINSLPDTVTANLETAKLLIISSPFGLYGEKPHLSELPLPVLEFGWGSLASKIDDHLVGSFADYSIFSFNTEGVINTGYGGVLFIREKKNTSGLKSLKSQHNRDNQVVKYDYRVSDVLSALGIIQLQNIDTYIEARKHIFEIYNAQFRQINVEPLTIPAEADYNHWLYPIRITGNAISFREKMRRKGIGTSYVVDRPLYFYLDQPAADFELTDRFYRKHVCLPVYPSLRRSEVDKITKTICNTVF